MPFVTIHLQPDYNLGKILKIMTEEKLMYSVAPNLKEMMPWVLKKESEEAQQSNLLNNTSEVSINDQIDEKPTNDFLMSLTAVAPMEQNIRQETLPLDEVSLKNEEVELPGPSRTSTLDTTSSVTRKRKHGRDVDAERNETPLRRSGRHQLNGPLNDTINDSFNGTLNETPENAAWNKILDLEGQDKKSETHPFVCETCGLAFTRKHYRHLHSKNHTENKNIQICTDCGKRMPHVQALRDHMARHNGQKPHSCPNCTKTFTSYGACWKHKKKCCRNDVDGN